MGREIKDKKCLDDKLPEILIFVKKIDKAGCIFVDKIGKNGQNEKEFLTLRSSAESIKSI